MVDVVTADFAPLFAVSLMALIPGFMLLAGAGMAYVRGHKAPQVIMGVMGTLTIAAAILMVNYKVETPSSVLTMQALEEHYGVEFATRTSLPEKDGPDVPTDVLVPVNGDEIIVPVYVRHTSEGKAMLIDAEDFGVEFSIDNVLVRQG